MTHFKIPSEDIQSIIGDCLNTRAQIIRDLQKINSIIERVNASWSPDGEGENLLVSLNLHNEQNYVLIDDIDALVAYLESANLAFQAAESKLINLFMESN